MSNIKVGDRVRRTRYSHLGMDVGDEATVVAIQGEFAIQLSDFTGDDGGGAHDPRNLEVLLPAAEADPTGRDPHTPGAKLDAGKTEFGLIMHGMPRALRQVARVATYGANKYTRDGWLSVPDAPRRYTDAMYRHFIAEACGELHDPDTQLEHAAHAAWNALARLELLLRGQGTS